MRHTSRRLQRGVSLIEALVAFGVMAFGMMAVVGMQATLRGNGDLARQRAEAVRIAQDAIEEWRGFTTLVTTTNRTAYADIVTTTDPPLTPPGSNTSYLLTRRVSSDAAVAGTVTPDRRLLTVDVEWVDRRDQTQSVRLVTSIVGVEPELSASLVLGAAPEKVLQPLGRHRAVPTTAVPFGVGRSAYMPPGQTGSGPRVAWVFDNTTGELSICSTTGLTTSAIPTSGVSSCNDGRALLVSGTVRFATDGDPAASPTSVADPTGPAFPTFSLRIEQTTGLNPNTSVTCFQQPLVDSQVLYECAVAITDESDFWGGYFAFGSMNIASSVSSMSSTDFKVCRYHANATYADVRTAQLSQNFVIIKAGNDAQSYQCPTASTPRTWAHQPY
jgi:Prokaryotic N-terminal methylation motif